MTNVTHKIQLIRFIKLWKHPCRAVGIKAQRLPHETEGLQISGKTLKPLINQIMERECSLQFDIVSNNRGITEAGVDFAI
jgi:hypothetical protein